jgi:hypothetical protein
VPFVTRSSSLAYAFRRRRDRAFVFPLTLAEPIVYVFVEHEMSLYACMVPLKVAIPLTVISFITALESQV